MIKKIGIILFLLLSAQYGGRPQGAAPTGLAFAQLQDDGQPCPPECVTDSMEIVTWYPSPYNEYEELRLYPISDPNSQCIDANRGLMYYDSEEDKVKLCKGPAGFNNWQDLSYWEPSTINTDDIYYNTGNVGIGTASPSQKLDVEGGIEIGNTSNETAGAIRFTGSDFEGYTGTEWKSLTASSVTTQAGLPFYGTAHTKEQCQTAGGTVTDYQSNSYCKFSANSCPSGWTKYQNLGSTVSTTCDGSSCGFCGGYCCSGTTCSTANHNFGNIPTEVCEYRGATADCSSGLGAQCFPGTGAQYNCFANIIEVGCY